MYVCHTFKLNFIFVLIFDVHGSRDEENLLTDLFQTYNRDLRPVANNNDTVNVRIKHTMKKILDVDERNEVFVTSGWCSLSWNDSYLSWNPIQYNGIKSINISPQKIWIPDVVLYDNINGDVFGSNAIQLQTLLNIDYTGNVIWGLRAKFETQCHFNIRDFPFDTQSCPLRYGSWSYEKGRIDICRKSEIKIEHSAMHNGWKVLSSSSSIVLRNYTGGIYESIELSITFKRKALLRTLNLLLPPLIVGTLVLLSFLLPAASGERIALSVTLLLAMIFFMLNSTRLIPKDDTTIPIIYKFFVATLVEILFLHIFLIFGLQFYYKASYDPPMPGWIRKIVFDKLSYWVGTRAERNENHNIYLKSEDLLSIIEIGFISRDFSNVRTKSTSQPATSINQESMKGEIILMEWRIVAMTIDRCFLLGFALIFGTIMIAFISKVILL